MTLQGFFGGFPAGPDDDAAPARCGVKHRVQIPPADSPCDTLKQGEVHRTDDIAVPRGQRVEGAVAQAETASVVNWLEAVLGKRGVHDLPGAAAMAALSRPAATGGTPDL
jgi:predicted small lipoprotein YifL